MKTVELGCYGIVIRDHGAGSASITDKLREKVDYEALENGCGEARSMEDFNNMIDGLTSMILAHYCAGIDVTTPAYLEGIETAVNACGNYA
jgi:CheY-specific phosphatase CheX